MGAVGDVLDMLCASVYISAKDERNRREAAARAVARTFFEGFFLMGFLDGVFFFRENKGINKEK